MFTYVYRNQYDLYKIYYFGSMLCFFGIAFCNSDFQALTTFTCNLGSVVSKSGQKHLIPFERYPNSTPEPISVTLTVKCSETYCVQLEPHFYIIHFNRAMRGGGVSNIKTTTLDINLILMSKRRLISGVFRDIYFQPPFGLKTLRISFLYLIQMHLRLYFLLHRLGEKVKKTRKKRSMNNIKKITQTTAVL